MGSLLPCHLKAATEAEAEAETATEAIHTTVVSPPLGSNRLRRSPPLAAPTYLRTRRRRPSPPPSPLHLVGITTRLLPPPRPSLRLPRRWGLLLLTFTPL